MISHEHKCIFIHISKCAGTSIERIFGLENRQLNYDLLYGWCPKNHLYLQHATPQQLLDFGYIDKATWDSYYKFVIVRNPWDRAYSDYLWSIENEKIFDSFSNFIQAKGKFKDSFSKERDYNIADHLYPQCDYFTIDSEVIIYDKVISFETITKGLSELASELSLPSSVFSKKENVNKARLKDYSLFYTKKRKDLVEKLFKNDIEKFNYSFDDKRSVWDLFKAHFLFFFHPNSGHFFVLKYPNLGRALVSFKKRFS